MSYIEFKYKGMIENWVDKNYGAWIKSIQKDKYSSFDDDIASLLFCYSGNMNEIYNKLLRGWNLSLSKEDIDLYNKQIEIINNEILNHQINDNIITCRFTGTKLIKCLNNGNRIKNGTVFVDNAFVSTTLLPSLMLSFARERKYNCLLKIYIPKGSNALYLKFNKSRLDEEELLLPLGCTFKVKNKYYDFKIMKVVYECDLLEINRK